jgi:hypothetical protein
MSNITLNSRYPKHQPNAKIIAKFGSVTTSLIYLKVSLEIYLGGPGVS